MLSLIGCMMCTVNRANAMHAPLLLLLLCGPQLVHGLQQLRGQPPATPPAAVPGREERLCAHTYIYTHGNTKSRV